MGECKHTGKLCDKLRKIGVLVFPIAGGKFQTPGLPDRMLICCKHVFLIEFKEPGKKLSTAQRLVRNKIHLVAPGVVFSCVFENDGMLTLWDADNCWWQVSGSDAEQFIRVLLGWNVGEWNVVAG